MQLNVRIIYFNIQLWNSAEKRDEEDYIKKYREQEAKNR